MEITVATAARTVAGVRADGIEQRGIDNRRHE
jgi:hypothetical protein